MPEGIDPVRDAFLRRQYKKIVMSRLRLVDLPVGKVMERFILRLVEEFKGIRERLWNSERVLVFLAVILRQEPDVHKYCDIRKFIAKRLDEWEAGRYTTLVSKVEERGRMSTIKRERSNDDQVVRKYNAMVMAGESAISSAPSHRMHGRWSVGTV